MENGIKISLSFDSVTSTELAASLDAYNDDLAEWINDLIDGETFENLANTNNQGTQVNPVDLTLTETDNKVAQLATKLEIACQETSSQLERTIEDISRNVPRLTYDLQFMRESALTLQRELNSIHQQTAGVIGDTTSISPSRPGENDATTKALEQIQFLDTVKRGMESARAVLQEAENWNTLESETSSLLKEGSFTKAADRLSEASKSMAVFQHTPEYESRRNLMINLQNQTEAAISSALVAAINSRDMQKCKVFHEVFEKIEREAEFRNYYFGARRAGVTTMWSKVVLSDVQGELNPNTISHDQVSALKFNELLTRFLSELSNLINEERLSIPTIFSATVKESELGSDPTSIISLFIQSVIEGLTPSLSQRLSGMAAHYGPKALVELLKAFKLTEEFAVKVEKVLEKVALAKSSSLAVSPPTPGLAPSTRDGREDPQAGKGHARNKSKRMSISRRIPSHRNTISMGVTGVGMASSSSIFVDYTWQQPLFEAFMDFQSDYSSLEKRFLESELERIDRENKEDAAHAQLQTGTIGDAEAAEIKARLLREKAVDVFTAAEESLVTCLGFTHGYGAVGATQSVDHLFILFFESAQKELLQSQQSAKRSGSGLARQSSLSPDTPAFGGVSGFMEDALSQDDLTAFQLCLNLLNTARLFKERLSLLDSRFRSEFVQVAQLVRGSSNPQLQTQIPVEGFFNPSSLFPFMEGVARGEAEILMQSTLNSMEFQNLLESVEYLVQPPAPGTYGSGLGSTPPTPTGAGTIIRSEKQQPIRIQPILRGSYKAIADFARAIQLYLQQIIITPLQVNLSSYHSLPSWSSSSASQNQRGGSSGFGFGLGFGLGSDYSMPAFSMTLTSTMQAVCDGLTALPRIFEDYLGDAEALSFSLETLPFVERDQDPSVKEYLEWVAKGQQIFPDRERERERDGAQNSPRSKRMSVSSPSFRRMSFTSPPSATFQPSSYSSYSSSGPVPKPPVLSTETVRFAWLSSIMLSILSHLTSSVLPQVRALTPSGAAQLAYDLSNFSTIGKTLSSDDPDSLESTEKLEGPGGSEKLESGWSVLEKWIEYCEMNQEDGRKRWLAIQGVSAFSHGSGVDADKDLVFKQIARIRGWTS